ncbi:MAG: GDYXXLXY domain-containing protein [Gammaproteobacteria bacterium]|nr:GDYXXLXY domain-containing protein [Gammaproteobacteria bacterium]
MNRRLLAGVVLAIGFQFVVLSGMYVNAALPTWTGSEIRVKSVPVDPRSMFRGNYARLSYKFSRIERKQFLKDEELRNGEVVYAVLKPTPDGLYELSQVVLGMPESGVFIRGRVKSRRGWRRGWRRGVGSFQVSYGIEAFFAPKEKALQLEKALRDGGVAVLMVSAGGKARIKDVVAH